VKPPRNLAKNPFFTLVQNEVFTSVIKTLEFLIFHQSEIRIQQLCLEMVYLFFRLKAGEGEILKIFSEEKLFELGIS
jgi:hypothetical protein